VPVKWRSERVHSAPIPVENTIGAALSFGIQQTGQLDKANDKFDDGMEIIINCENLVEEARKKIEPRPWYKFW